MMVTTSRQLTPRQQQAAARREQILGAAVRLFGTHGFAGTTTRQIAQEAGITEGLIFRYFPTKAGILHALASERDALAQVLAGSLQGTEGLATRAVLERVATAWLVAARREADFMSMLISEGQINPAVRGVLHGAIDAAVDDLARFLAPRARAGDLRPDIPLHTVAANFFAALLLFFITHRHADDARWDERAGAFIPDLVDTWLHGAVAVPGARRDLAHRGGTCGRV